MLLGLGDSSHHFLQPRVLLIAFSPHLQNQISHLGRVALHHIGAVVFNEVRREIALACAARGTQSRIRCSVLVSAAGPARVQMAPYTLGLGRARLCAASSLEIWKTGLTLKELLLGPHGADKVVGRAVLIALLRDLDTSRYAVRHHARRGVDRITKYVEPRVLVSNHTCHDGARVHSNSQLQVIVLEHLACLQPP